MSADVWAYSGLIKTTVEEYKAVYSKTEDIKHNYFDVLIVESGYADAEKKVPGIMAPYEVGDIYAVTKQSVVYNGNLGDYDHLEEFLDALNEFKDESVDDEEAFSEMEHVIDYDMLIGIEMCDKLNTDFEDNREEFKSWCKNNECPRYILDIYDVIAHAVNIGKASGCVLIG